MPHDALSPDFVQVIDPGSPVERLANGFGFTEGPIWHAGEHHLTFSDMPQNHLRRWSPNGQIATVRQPSNMANGNAYDRDGSIITCEHATSSVVRTGVDGSKRVVLADRYRGRELNSPNDVVVKGDGTIYFTDPTYGRMEYYGVPRTPELEFRGVYCIVPATSELRLLANDFVQPNGLCFSEDERRLFVNDTERKHIRVFEVKDDGSLEGGAVWAEVGGDGSGAPDGMKMDKAGLLFCTGPRGIHIFDPNARLLGIIEIPEYTANFTWGSPDLCDLFITASTSLYRIKMKRPGLSGHTSLSGQGPSR